MTQLNFEFDVRIPDVLVQQMMDGEITAAMLVTMTILYKWANWKTGRVRWCSSGGLRTASRKAYSDRTFRVSLQRLEEMGWITRHMVPGSHDDYPVTIHNYKWVCDGTCGEHGKEDAGKVHILNPKDIKVSDPFKTGVCREGSQETSHEGSQETSQEGSQKDLLNTEPKLLPETEPDLLSDNDGVSKLVSQLAEDSSFRSSSLPEEQDTQTLQTVQAKTETEDKDNTEDLDPITASVDSKILTRLLGIEYFTPDHVPDMKRIARVLKQRNRSVLWLEKLTAWAKPHKFWKTRLYSGDRALGQLATHLEKGSIAEQFDSHLTVLMAGKNSNHNHKDPFHPMPGGNPLLLKDYVSERIALNPELHPPKEIIGGSAWDAYADTLRTEPEPGSMEAVMTANQAQAKRDCLCGEGCNGFCKLECDLEDNDPKVVAAAEKRLEEIQRNRAKAKAAAATTEKRSLFEMEDE